MHDAMRNPSEGPARDELPSGLRAVVEQIHAQPLPFGALSDALDRAKRLEGPTMTQAKKYGWRQMAIAAAVLAAAVLGPMILAVAWEQDLQGDGDDSRYASTLWGYETYQYGPTPTGTTPIPSREHSRRHSMIVLNGDSQAKAVFLDAEDDKAVLPRGAGDFDFDGALGFEITGGWRAEREKAAITLQGADKDRLHGLKSEEALIERIREVTGTPRDWMPLTALEQGKTTVPPQRMVIWEGAIPTEKQFDNLRKALKGKEVFEADGKKVTVLRGSDIQSVDLPKQQSGLIQALPAGKRAMSIKLDANTPEILKNFPNIRVLAVDIPDGHAREQQALVGSTVTLEVTREEAQRLDLAQQLAGQERPTPNSPESEERLRKLLEQVNKQLKSAAEKKPPQVWKQHRGRPTFARVYIGDGNALELVSLHVTTTVDGPRARTVVDHVFRNPHERQLEGTFEYPLPTGASPSYYAMFPGKTRTEAPPLFTRRGQAPPLAGELLASLKPQEMARSINSDDWGNLMESRVVNKEKALETYEEVTRRRTDPALLEYAGGNTFSGRVFPIPPKGFSRVILAYEELLPVIGTEDVYRFALPDCKLSDVQFTLQADAKLVGRISNPSDQGTDWKSVLRQGVGNGVYEKHWTNEGPGGEVRFTFTLPEPRIHVASGRQNDGGPLYVYARLRPELKAEQAKPFAENAVFLLDTSLSEHPDRFAVNMLLMRRILESDPDISHFNILAFNVGAAWVEPKGWIRNTKAGRERAFNALDGIVLEGATDLSSALDKLSTTPFIVSRSRDPLNVFVLSDGQITWGESDVNTLVSRFESRCQTRTRFHCYRTGLGADNLELFSALTRRGGGVFNCFSEADLPAVAVAHRNHCFTVDSVRFVGGPTVSDVLIAGRRAAVYPGGELIVAGRATETGKTQLVVEGTYLGQKLVQEYPVEITGTGELAARGWGEVAVASLLSLNDPKHEGLVTAYCQQFGIGSRVASFLILENENEYKRFNLDEARGKTLTGDLGQWLEETWKGLGKVPSPKESLTRFLDRIEPRVKLMSGAQGEHFKKLLALMADADCELPQAVVNGKLLRKGDVAPVYLAMRDNDPRNVNTYLDEARRRAAKQDVDGAVRVLSNVVEEHPGRGDALRLVGYRLLDMQQPAHAARLFDRVERNRPFEPHSYRDLARALEAAGKFGLAAIHYEIILAGTWHARFHDSLKQVALEEYAAMMRDAIRRRAVMGKLADHFGERLEKMDPSKAQSDLRVTISWNTDATDVDLWVIEPDGEKCFYSHNKTKSGGELSQDMTQGYGPERYTVKKAEKGTYRVMVNYFAVNPNLLGGETHVNVTVTRFAGTPQETTERHTVILRRDKEEVEVCRVEY